MPRPHWDKVVGKSGRLEIEHREYTTSEGEKRTTNQVKKYIDPADAASGDGAKPAAW